MTLLFVALSWPAPAKVQLRGTARFRRPIDAAKKIEPDGVILV